MAPVGFKERPKYFIVLCGVVISRGRVGVMTFWKNLWYFNNNLLALISHPRRKHRMRKNYTEGVEPSEEIVVLDLDSCSDKTQDSQSAFLQPSLLNRIQLIAQTSCDQVGFNIGKLSTISGGTFSSDKLVRLTGSFIKTSKNFELLTDRTRMDKLAMQLGQLRRLLRFNRFGSILRDYVKFPNAQNKTARDFFDMGFKLLMFATDVLDILAYLMELKVIKESNLKVLKKFIANLYFFECVTWTLLHLYEFFTKKDSRTPKEATKKKFMILKYILDSVTSHNDYSARRFSLQPKTATVVGLASSLLGLGLIWV